MANPVANAQLSFHGNSGPVVAYPMPANTRLFSGTYVQKSSGGLIELPDGAAAGQFLGVLGQEADNRTGGPMGGLQGALANVHVDFLAWVTVNKATAIALSDVTSTVYASDGGTLTMTAGTNTSVGKVVAVDASAVGANPGLCLVRFQGLANRSI